MATSSPSGGERKLHENHAPAGAEPPDRESLLDQYARELGLSISDEQVKQAIFQTQAFQTNGKFDNQRFSGIVAQMGMTTDQYAQALLTS